MIRKSHCAAALLGLVVALPACANTAGDGNLTNNWAPMPDPQAAAPKVGTCYASTATSADTMNIEVGTTKTSCDAFHALETFYVGEISGDLAARPSPPAYGTAEERGIFAKCEAAAKEFLGDDWFVGRVYPLLTLPQLAQWSAGARYFRCDLVEIASLYTGILIRRSSLRDGLRGARPLAFGCELYDAGDMQEVRCAGPHDTEFAGVHIGGDEWLEDDARLDACEKTVAAYVGGQVGKMGVGSLEFPWGRNLWSLGYRQVRCFATAPRGMKLVGSVKGIGNRAPKTA